MAGRIIHILPTPSLSRVLLVLFERGKTRRPRGNPLSTGINLYKVFPTFELYAKQIRQIDETTADSTVYTENNEIKRFLKTNRCKIIRN